MANETQPQTSGDGPKAQTGAEKRQFTLTAAKDRAQLTATTAMSVVHVALLKSLVDGGPDANRYYVVVIVLIVVALAVQVVIGGLAIFVTHTRNFYQKYHTDMCSEFTAYWCKCFSCCNNKTSKTVTGMDNPGLDVSRIEVVVGEDVLDNGNRNNTNATANPMWVLPEATKAGLHAVARDVHVSFSVRLLQAELAAIEAEAELGDLNRQLERETRRLDTFIIDKVKDRVRHTDNDVTKSLEAGENQVSSALESSQEKHFTESQNRIREIEEKIIKCEAIVRHLKVIRRQKDLVGDHVDETKASNVLKKVQFWQNVINYLLYVVFICNAFITGLGVTGGQAADSGGNLTGNGGQANAVR